MEEPGNRATLLAVLLTRLNRVVFDSFLHFHFIAAGDGSALEEGKTRKVTVPHTTMHDTCWTTLLKVLSKFGIYKVWRWILLNLGENGAILYISFWATGFYSIGGQVLSMESGEYVCCVDMSDMN